MSGPFITQVRRILAETPYQIFCISDSLQDFIEWLDDPEKLGGEYEEKHVECYGDCGCIPGFWKPRRRGLSDMCSIETCSLCQAQFYEAYEADIHLRDQDWDAETHQFQEEWAAIFTILDLDAGEESDRYPLRLCPCCWGNLLGKGTPVGEVSRDTEQT